MTSGAVGGTGWLKGQTKKIGNGERPPVSLQDALAIRVESWLQQHEVQYAPPTMIPLDAIDRRRSQGNQARREPIVNDSVERFANSMRSGAPFPPIVCFPFSGKLVVVDGNNRLAAASKLEMEAIFGIVISEHTPSEVISALTVEANAHHGVTPELSWRIEQAFHLISLGYSDVAAGEQSNVTPQQIQTTRRLREADDRARDMKIAGFEGLPTTIRGMVGALRDDPVFFAASRCAIRTEMKIEEVRDMLRMLKGYTSESAKIAAISDLQSEREQEVRRIKVLGRTGGPNPRAISPRGQLASGIGMMMKVDLAGLRSSLLTEADQHAVAERLAEAKRHIEQMQRMVAGMEGDK